MFLQRYEPTTRPDADFKENIVYKKSYCVKDFEKDYHAYKGNAYGLAKNKV